MLHTAYFIVYADDRIPSLLDLMKTYQAMAAKGILLIFLILTFLAESDGRKCCIEPYTDLQKLCTVIKLSCPRDNLIYKPQIEAIQNIRRCRTPSRGSCSGQSAQNIADAFNCYWQISCNITFPGNYFVKVKANRPDNCSSTTTALRIKRWRCLDVSKLRIYDMSNSSVQSITGPTNGTINGIIRSHPYTPWDYDDSVFNNSKMRQSADKIIRWTLKTFESCYIDNCASNVLDITTDFVDLDQDAKESLYFKYKPPQGKIERKYIRRPGTKRFNMGQGSRLTVYFQRETDHISGSGVCTKGGRGFVLCFRYGAFKGNKRNVCKRVMNAKNAKARVIRLKSPECQNADMLKCTRNRKRKRKHTRKNKNKKGTTR